MSRSWATLVCLIGLTGFGCNRGSSTATSPGSGFRVALILPGSATDKGWNQLAAESLKRMEQELGAQTKCIERLASSDFATQINYYASEGYDVIICHGGEFKDPVADAAKKYPKVHFIVGGCDTDIPGAVAVEFLARDASTLVGVVAAQVSRTHTAGFVGAVEVPPLQACYNGLKDGLTLLPDSPATKLLPALWTNSWDSPTKAKEAAESAISAGADVVYQNVDAAAAGVFEAAHAANKPAHPVFAFGCNSNQNDMMPDVILGSVVIDVPRAYLDLTRAAKEGKLVNGAQKLGLAGGYVDLVLNDKHPAITSDIRQKVEAAREKLLKK